MKALKIVSVLVLTIFLSVYITSILDRKNVPTDDFYITNENLIKDFNSFDSTAVISNIYKCPADTKFDSCVVIVVQYKDSLFYYKSKDSYASNLITQKRDGDYLK